MRLLDLLASLGGRSAAPPAPSAPQGSTFLEGLLSGSGAGAPPGFDRMHPSVMGMEGTKYYPEFRFGYSGTPALERLGVTQPGGMPPGLAMQIAQSQYFAPGSGQGVNMAGNRAPAPSAPAPNPNPGGQLVEWPGYGAYFSPRKTVEGQSPQDLINEYNRMAANRR